MIFCCDNMVYLKKIVNVPSVKLRIVANTYVVTVPRKIVESHKLRKGKRYSFDIYDIIRDKKEIDKVKEEKEIWDLGEMK